LLSAVLHKPPALATLHCRLTLLPTHGGISVPTNTWPLRVYARGHETATDRRQLILSASDRQLVIRHGNAGNHFDIDMKTLPLTEAPIGVTWLTTLGGGMSIRYFNLQKSQVRKIQKISLNTGFSFSLSLHQPHNRSENISIFYFTSSTQ
jgi:hypothetical protein